MVVTGFFVLCMSDVLIQQYNDLRVFGSMNILAEIYDCITTTEGKAKQRKLPYVASDCLYLQQRCFRICY